jgi:hypothetical protein
MMDTKLTSVRMCGQRIGLLLNILGNGFNAIFIKLYNKIWRMRPMSIRRKLLIHSKLINHYTY